MSNPSVCQNADPFLSLCAPSELTDEERRTIRNSLDGNIRPKRSDQGHVLLFSEEDILALFCRTEFPAQTDKCLGPDFYRGEPVLVIPGYGTLPLWLGDLGAGVVYAVDKDPATIAWQKARLLYFSDDEFRESSFQLVTTRKNFLVSSNILIQKLYGNVIHDRSRINPHRSNVFFSSGDIFGALPAPPERYKLIVVPFLIGFPNGLQDESSWNTAIDNLLTYLKPGGAICVTPATIEQAPEIAKPQAWARDLLAGMARFKEYLEARADIRVAFGREEESVNSVPPSARTRYALIAPSQHGRPPWER